MTDAYSTGIEITAQLRKGNSLPLSIAESSIRIEFLGDDCPEWHPAPHSFPGMVRLLIYREITGESYRGLSQYQEFAELFDLKVVSEESVLSRTWRKRSTDGVREFNSQRVFQLLSNLGVNYLILKRINSTEREVVETMEAVAVESASVHIEAGSHSMRFLYVPSTKADGTTVFATNLPIGPEEAKSFCRRYSRRWQIENEYKSIKNDFLAKTSSKDYRVRLFYFVFAVVLYNIWRLTDFLLKADVDGEMDYAPMLTANECVELVASGLIPPD